MFIISLMCIFTLLAQAATLPQSSTGLYRGWYTNSQGQLCLDLNVSQNMATFSFYSWPGTSLANGDYSMSVGYKTNGKITLRGIEWTNKPYGWEFVDLVGQISDGIFSGNVYWGSDATRQDKGKKIGKFSVIKIV
jgi:hypothetical protein